MKQREDTDRHATLLVEQKTARKPYRKPAVRHEQVFETSALSCGKIQTTQGQCAMNRNAS
jgi:hypothetical protein